MMNKDPYNKVILTDCDGVLLNWGYAFGIYMQEQGCERRQEGWGTYNVADNFYISKQEAKEAIDMYYLTEGGMAELGQLARKWGIEPKKIEKAGLNVLGSVGGYTAGNEPKKA